VLSETDECRHESVLRFAHLGCLAINAVSTFELAEDVRLRNLCHVGGFGVKVCSVGFINCLSSNPEEKLRFPISSKEIRNFHGG
jgi:hypothetical protein